MTEHELIDEEHEFRVSFKPELLDVHLAYNPDELHTTRARQLGKVGDITFIAEAWWILSEVITGNLNEVLKFYQVEGFKTEDEFKSVLTGIYPSYTKFFVHKLLRINEKIYSWIESD